MYFSFSSLINMTITGSMLTGVIYILLKNNKILAHFGTTLILGCSMIVMFRFLLPFEFSFTNSYYVKDIWPAIYLFLINDLPFLMGIGLHISPCEILLTTWVLVSIALFIRSYLAYRVIKGNIYRFQKVQDPVVLSLAEDITKKCNSKKVFTLVDTKEFVTPMIFGINTPIIVLPRLSLTKAEWSYILQHEITHYRSGHLYIKLICELLSILYWWNPFVYIFKKLINNLLELNVDYQVTRSLPDNEKLEYLACLLKIAKISSLCWNNAQWSMTFTSFSSRDSTLISQRIHMICYKINEKQRKLILPVFLIILSYIIFLYASFFVIVEPSYISQEHATGSFSPSDDGCYMIRNKDGTYDLFIDSQYITTSDKPLDDPNITIYNSQEEVLLDAFD